MQLPAKRPVWLGGHIVIVSLCSYLLHVLYFDVLRRQLEIETESNYVIDNVREECTRGGVSCPYNPTTAHIIVTPAGQWSW